LPSISVLDRFWPECVAEFFRNSRLALIGFDAKDSVSQEIDIALETIDPKRLLIGFAERGDWKHFRTTHGGVWPHPPPPPQTPVALLGFAGDWRARVIASHENGGLVNFEDGIRAYMAEVPPASKPVWKWPNSSHWPFAQIRLPGLHGS
jgi:hypothetical protein